MLMKMERQSSHSHTISPERSRRGAWPTAASITVEGRLHRRPASTARRRSSKPSRPTSPHTPVTTIIAASAHRRGSERLQMYDLTSDSVCPAPQRCTRHPREVRGGQPTVLATSAPMLLSMTAKFSSPPRPVSGCRSAASVGQRGCACWSKMLRIVAGVRRPRAVLRPQDKARPERVAPPTRRGSATAAFVVGHVLGRWAGRPARRAVWGGSPATHAHGRLAFGLPITSKASSSSTSACPGRS